MVREIYTVNDGGVDNAPKMNLIGMDTPQSSGFDTSSVPFIFSDGVLSFYSQSTDSIDSGFAPSVSPPASSVSNASFLGVLPDSPRSSKLSSLPVLQRLAIWRHNEEKDHVYAETSCINGADPQETISLEDLDPSLVRYGAVHTSLTQMSTMFYPALHVFITLTPYSPAIAEDPHPIDSVITISTPSRRPVRLMCAIYNRGTLQFANETVMTEEAPSDFGDAHYSTALPQQLVDELCEDVDGLYSREEGTLDRIALLQFMQHRDMAESRDENIILVLVCDFMANQGPRPSQARFSNLSLGTIHPNDLTMHKDSLPTPSSSRENLSDAKHFSLESIEISKQRTSSRTFPNLSVAIPPPWHAKGRIQLYTDSPGPTLTLTPDISFPLTPQTGVPQNVFPVTPFDQLIATPLHPPEMDHSRVCSRVGHVPIPMENAYPFTLTTASPSAIQSPAFGLLDSSHPEEPEPPWPYRSRSCTPSTSSPLPRPYASSASNAPSTITRHPIQVRPPAFSSSYMETSFDQPLTSPHPVASVPHLIPLPQSSRPKSP